MYVATVDLASSPPVWSLCSPQAVLPDPGKPLQARQGPFTLLLLLHIPVGAATRSKKAKAKALEEKMKQRGPRKQWAVTPSDQSVVVKLFLCVSCSARHGGLRDSEDVSCRGP